MWKLKKTKNLNFGLFQISCFKSLKSLFLPALCGTWDRPSGWQNRSSIWQAMVSDNQHATPVFTARWLCIRGTSHGPVSVCLCLSVSVTSRSSTKTDKQRITRTTPHDSPGTLVFWCQRSPWNSTGIIPYEGAKCRWGGSKSATFD